MVYPSVDFLKIQYHDRRLIRFRASGFHPPVFCKMDSFRWDEIHQNDPELSIPWASWRATFPQIRFGIPLPLNNQYTVSPLLRVWPYHGCRVLRNFFPSSPSKSWYGLPSRSIDLQRHWRSVSLLWPSGRYWGSSPKDDRNIQVHSMSDHL